MTNVRSSEGSLENGHFFEEPRDRRELVKSRVPKMRLYLGAKVAEQQEGGRCAALRA